jgi:uncharacterized membrane protein YeaQ/YmgE (transglycosylase-associated protein family)
MEVTGFWSALFTGIVIGVLGRVLLRGRQAIGFLWTILAGIGGALAGSWLAGQFGWDGFSEFILQVVAAAILVAGVGKLTQ